MKQLFTFSLMCISALCISLPAGAQGNKPGTPSPAGTNANSPANDLLLHYDRPADFFEEALVIGNGTMGAILYNGVTQDRISLNDLTLWTGEPDRKVITPDAYKALPEIRQLLDNEDYRGADQANKKVQGHYSENYQPLGTLTITHDNHRGKTVSAYRRQLNISNATAQAQYRIDGGNFATDYFASAPDSVIIIRLTSETPDGIQARLSFTSPLPHSTRAEGNAISAEGYAAYHSYPNYYGDLKDSEKHLYDPERGIHFRTIVHVSTTGGKVTAFPSGDLKIDHAKEAVIRIANATSFNGFDKDPVREGRPYRKLAEQRIRKATQKSYAEMRRAHIEDYKRYFDRVSLNLGETSPEILALPTDRQLRLYTDEQQRNPHLEALYFQYGRYLLISCSRTPGVPANLQGLWNESMLPPWSSNYTTNINLEENYWAAEVTNLSEMHRPLMDFISHLSQTGEKTARAYYGVDKGWCLAHNSDIWAMTCPVGLNGGDPSWACWNMGGAWIATHIWEHYLFTQDKDFLRTHYPILKGAAEFCLNWLVEKDGKLITSPGTSPENKFITPDGYAGATSYGCTADLAFTRQCLMDARDAAEVLGTDKDFRKTADRTLSRLLPYRIGKEGNLQEWYHDWRDRDVRHRHQSHLFGLYPGHHLSVAETPELAKACARTLEMKGDETTGWSTGWRVNLYARLQDSAGAYRIYRRLLKYISPDKYQGKDARRGGGTYPNLLDAHSPFQIDGNFGGCAGVAEMLMQSTPDKITLLPALPEAWSDGQVKGICARGGFVVDMEWKQGKVTSLTVSSRKGGKTQLHFNGKKVSLKLKAGEQKSLL